MKRRLSIIFLAMCMVFCLTACGAIKDFVEELAGENQENHVECGCSYDCHCHKSPDQCNCDKDATGDHSQDSDCGCEYECHCHKSPDECDCESETVG